MRIVGSIAYIMPVACFVTTVAMVCTTCNVDGIDETVFAEGIGKVPEGFLVTGGDEVKLVTNAANGSTLHLAMQEETARDGTIADENELADLAALTIR